MTRLQRKVLLFIQEQQDQGNSVTVSRIVEETRRSRGNCHRAINTLVALGHITRRPRQARSYEVVRRIEPIVEHWVWCPARQELVRLEDRKDAA